MSKRSRKRHTNIDNEVCDDLERCDPQPTIFYKIRFLRLRAPQQPRSLVSTVRLKQIGAEMSKQIKKRSLTTRQEIEAILQALRSAGSDLQHSKRRYASYDFLGTVYGIHSQCRARDSLKRLKTMLLRLTQDPSKKRHTFRSLD